MPKKHFSTEQALMKLREIEALTGQGETAAMSCRQAGLKVPANQNKRGRIWLNDGSCVRHRAEHVNHV